MIRIDSVEQMSTRSNRARQNREVEVLEVPEVQLPEDLLTREDDTLETGSRAAGQPEPWAWMGRRRQCLGIAVAV